MILERFTRTHQPASVYHFANHLRTQSDFGNPEAPLLTSHRRHDRPMWPANAATLLKSLGQGAGIRHVHPHLFRHTRATRASAAGWNEPPMRTYFGWSSSSKMPAHYIHLSHRNMEDRARRELGWMSTANASKLV